MKNVCAVAKKGCPRKGNSLVMEGSMQSLFVAVLVDLDLQGLDVVGVRRNLDISVILVQVALVVDDCRLGNGPQGVVDGDAEYTLRILYVSRLAVLRIGAVALVVEVVVSDNPVIVEVVALVGAGVGGTRTFGTREVLHRVLSAVPFAGLARACVHVAYAHQLDVARLAVV